MSLAMTPRSVGLFVAAALATGWLLGSATSQQTPDDGAAPRATGPRALGTGARPTTPYTLKLHERMKQQPAVPERGRNPFTFGSRRAAPARSSRVADPAPMELPAMPVEPPGPVFKLSGIAASQQDGVSVLTAIVIDNGVMTFVKQGDMLSGGHRVVRVDEFSITLEDAAGVTQTLRLP
jgi:hypothetical protein